MSDVTITVEVPITVQLTLDEPVQIHEERPPTGIGEIHQMIESKRNTDEFERIVKRMVRSENVSVRDVYPANSYTAEYGEQ